MKANLRKPFYDKGFCIEIENMTEEEHERGRITFLNAAYRFKHIFLQGFQDGWMLVEFWTLDRDIIDGVCNFFESELKIKIKR